MPATTVAVDGYRLTVEQVVTVARQAGRHQFELSEASVAAMTQSLTLRRDLVAAGLPIYGVTSGFGDSNSRQIHLDKAASLQENLLRFLNCGTGPAAPAEVTRATLLIRANCLARGQSAVRPELVALLLACLHRDLLPVIPERGSVGASGDLVPLSYVARMLTGEATVSDAGALRPAADALAGAGLRPLALEAKEGLAIVNGTSFMAAYATLALHDAEQLAFVAELCTALASQVLQGNPAHFAEFLFTHKPHPGLVGSARGIRDLLCGDRGRAPDGERGNYHDQSAPDRSWTGQGLRQLAQPLQDRYSIRCAPHVIGALRDTATWVRAMLAVEINSANDNPLFDAETATVHNGANFYGSHVGLAMDSLKTAVASVGDLLDRQLELVVDEKFNNGLTANLIAEVDPSHAQAGLHHGFKGMQLTASALVAEALRATMPATSFSRSTEAHNQDKVSMGTIAARDARTVVELVAQAAAVHLLALCQAADVRGPDCLSPRTAAAYRLLRQHSPFVERDRPLETDIVAAADLIRSGALRAAVAASD